MSVENHVKFETLTQSIDGRIKAPKIVEIDQMVRLCWAALSQKVEIFKFWGRVPTPVNRLARNCTQPSVPSCPSAVPIFT